MTRDRFRTLLGVLLAGAAVTGLAPAASAAGRHPLTWHAVLTHCHRTHACRAYVSPAIRRDLGVGPDWPARIQYGGTTVIWVRKPSGRVLTSTS
jgi:hypothetical protein